MGPRIVHRSMIENPHQLSIQTRVNGELRQNSNTEQLIFGIPTLISVMSAGMTLEPGDIIATGTPSGVGSGFKPTRFLKAGDEVEVTIEGIGTLKNIIE
jgi:2-keto-4-pentenoate hydratase/2-oxohepta-3-ene-1,7-dioic acid hydratase in catechol pathway